MIMKTFIILASNIKMCVHIIELHRERQACISNVISYQQNALSNSFHNFYFKNFHMMVYIHSNI